MDREQLGEWITAYIDGELNAEQTELVERLIQEDDAARSMADELRRVSGLVRSLPTHTAPASLTDDVQAFLERNELLGGTVERSRDRAGRRTALSAVASVAAMITLVAAGVWFLRGDSAGGKGDATALRSPAAADHVVDITAVDRDDAAEAESSGPGKEVLAMLDFDRKLRAGMGLKSIRTHSFDVEPFRLQVSVRGPQELDALANRVTRFLSKHDAKNLSTIVLADKNFSSVGQGFYYEGRRGRNFSGDDQRQVIVHLPRKDLDRLLDEVSSVTAGAEEIALRVGPLSFEGKDAVRDALAERGAVAGAGSSETRRGADDTVLARVDRPSNELARDDRGEVPAGDWLEGFLQMAELDARPDSRSVVDEREVSVADPRSGEMRGDRAGDGVPVDVDREQNASAPRAAGRREAGTEGRKVAAAEEPALVGRRTMGTDGPRSRAAQSSKLRASRDEAITSKRSPAGPPVVRPMRAAPMDAVSQDVTTPPATVAGVSGDLWITFVIRMSVTKSDSGDAPAGPEIRPIPAANNPSKPKPASGSRS